MKTCSVCKKQKDLSEFYRNRQHIDGLNYECKECHGVRTRIYRSRKPEWKERDRQYSKKYNKGHPNAHKSRLKRWLQNPENAEKRREKIRLWCQENRARKVSQNRERRRNNPAQTAYHQYKRRALDANACGYFDGVSLANRFAMFGGKCWICSGDANRVDHVKPLCVGGSNWPCNLRPICGPCNSSKCGRWHGVAQLNALAKRVAGRISRKPKQAGASPAPVGTD